ncbi:non-ribosomal peptide synthetase [Streptomyces aidingensis]|uniref:Amino acid adenylation domain-containing protein n=1 Tax=Streptomyces aidingensis TaxID=910347 RepID=A0A1I1T3L1_9ACTN|nr:non-ribosomal peptide synthetase [Streptomyces aidingensis]SFD53256.1 amino acid adenylation domain-containing protein [Streptomyces aidingensis]
MAEPTGTAGPAGDRDGTAEGLREAVTGIWCAVLGVDHVGPQDDFFLEGGDSGLAVETALSLRALTGTELDLDILYQYPRFGELLAALTGPPATATGEQRPLTPAEERLWIAERLRPGSPQYHIAALYRFPGGIDVLRLRAALDALAARHGALRRGFEAPGRAVTAERVSVPCRWLDARGVPEPALRELIDDYARAPFDLSRPPLLRALAVDRGDQGTLLLLTVHHLVCDGASLALLEDGLGRLYSAAPGPGGQQAAPPRERPSAAASRLLDRDESRAWWRRTLAGCPRGIALPHDLPRPAVPDGAGAVHTLVCDPQLLDRMAEMAARERLSPYMTWTVAYAAGLLALTGQRDLVAGVAVSSRSGEQRDEIGMFVDPLPLRLRLPEGVTARDLARQVRRGLTEALAHQGVPFQAIVAELGAQGEPGRAPLVQTGLTYLDASGCVLRLDGLRARRELLPTGTAKYELLWSVTRQADRTVAEFEYLSGLFSAERAAEAHTVMMAAAQAAFSRPDEPLRAPGPAPVPVPGPVPAPVSGPVAAGGRPLPELVRLHARQRPDAPALRHRDTELSYRELDARALAVAAGLRAAGLGRGSVVAVPMPRGAGTVLACLGIHYAGCAYLPLDPDQPPDRLRTAVRGVADAALVAGQAPPGLPPELPLLRLEDMPADPAGRAAGTVPVPVTGEDIAYLMSTSGSTGRPKTVVIPHRGISRLVPDAEGLAIRADDRVAHVCNPAFDAATLEVWGALGAGALLVVGDKEDVLSPARLRAFLAEHRITVLGLPTALLNTVIDFAPDALGGVRLLVFGGEKADEERLARLLAGRPPARVVNVYGPTENTTVSTLQQVTAADLEPGPLPIGRALSGSTAHALGPDGRPVAPGEEGELYVGGDGLAHGYHGNPALTAASFVPDPFGGRAGGRLYRTGDRVRPRPDGTFLFLGRTDDQVKVRGFRVELGEIELALRSLPGVTDAVAFARATPDGTELLACVAGGAGLPDAAALTGELRGTLPPYMVPAVVVTDRLPLNANGKVDRAALLAWLPRDLPRPGAPGGGAAGTDPVAEGVTALWCDALGVDRAHPDDSFVAGGGHSIKALKLLARVDEKFGTAVDLADFFADPTLGGLIAAVRQEDGGPAGRPPAASG